MADFKALWQDRVAQLESCSGVEVVVAVQAQAESYVDVHWKWAFLSTSLSLLLMVHSPLLFHPNGVFVNALFAGLIGYLASWRLPFLRRLLTTSARRRQQTERSALLAFERLKVTHTRERTGLLLLVSWFEKQALLLPDLGLTGRLPGAVLNEMQARLDAAQKRDQLEQAVGDVLQQLVQPLHHYVPRSGDDEDELSNQVRVL